MTRFETQADWGNSIIRRISLNTGLVSTLAGTLGRTGHVDGTGTAAVFNWPNGVAVNAAGTLALVADQVNFDIRAINVASGLVTTLAGHTGSYGNVDGVGTSAYFNYPTNVVLDALGSTALVADCLNHKIRRIDLTTATVTTLAGGGGAAVSGSADGQGTLSTFRFPWDVAIDAGGSVALVADTQNSRIRRIDISRGLVTTFAGNTTGYADGQGTSAQFNFTSSVAMDSAGGIAFVVRY